MKIQTERPSPLWLVAMSLTTAIAVIAGILAASGVLDLPSALIGAVTLANAPVALPELKALVESIARGFEEYKSTNDEKLKAKADGKVIGDFEAKLAKMDEALDALGEQKQKLDDAIVKLQREAALGSGDGKGASLAEEVKGFNLALRADMQTKGRPFHEISEDQYKAYKSGVYQYLRTGDLERLSSEERKAMSAGSDPDGGYLLPPPAMGRIVQKVYESSIMRQIATVQTISIDALEGITDNDEADSGWVSEMGTRNDTDTPTVGKYRLEVHEMYSQPKVTQKLLDDAAVDIESWLAGKVADKMSRVEGLAFWRGSGIGQPRGLADYTTAATDDDSRSWGTIEHVVTGANGAFHTDKADPLQTLLGKFRTQYLQGASWVMRREVRTLIRKMKEATSDRYLWEPSLQAGQPDRLLGYPVRIDQYMPTIATGSLSLAFGDFREAYTILDRVGIRVLRDPYTAKPYVRFYTTRRVGGGCVNFEAVKFLKFST